MIRLVTKTWSTVYRMVAELKTKLKTFIAKLREGVSSRAKFISLVGCGANNQTVELKNSSTTSVIAYIVDTNKLPEGVTLESFAKERGLESYAVMSNGDGKSIIADVESIDILQDLKENADSGLGSLYLIGDLEKSYATPVVMVTECEEESADAPPITVISSTDEEQYLMNAQEAPKELETKEVEAQEVKEPEVKPEETLAEAKPEELFNKGSMAEFAMGNPYAESIMKAFEAQFSQALLAATKQTTDVIAALESKVSSTLGTVESVLQDLNSKFAVTQELQNSAEEINTQLKASLNEATALNEALTASSVTVTHRTAGQPTVKRSVYDIP